MARFAELPLAGWGNLRPEPCHVYRPEKLSELGTTLAAAPSLIARGLGRSYGDSAVNPGGVALTTRLDCIVSFDPATGVVEAEAGVSLRELIDLFLPRGFFLPVTPGTQFVTLGGAVAADVHGKNHHVDGTIGRFVEQLTLLTADGTLHTCSRSENAELFFATLGGMGLTGLIVTVRLKLLPVESAYVRVSYRRAADLEAALALFASPESAAARYSVAWIDCLAGGAKLGRSVLMEGDHLRAADLASAGVSRRAADDPLRRPAGRTKSVPFTFPGFVLNRWSVKAFNWLYYKRHGDGTRALPIDPFFYPLDGIRHWNRIYGRRGFAQYQALFPTDTARQGLKELLEHLSGRGAASFLAVLKRTGDAGEGLLSFPFPGYTLALDLPFRDDRTTRLAAELDAILLRHGGRLYLAKDALTSPQAFRQMYPKLEQFLAIKAKVDPQNRFTSAQARRLGIVV